MRYYTFLVLCNDKYKTYSREGKNFMTALNKLPYKSFNKLEFIGTSNLLSEAIMAECDFAEKHPEYNLTAKERPIIEE